MTIFNRCTGFSVRSQFATCNFRVLHWLSLHGFSILAVGILLSAAILSLFIFVDAAISQIRDVYQPISSAWLFSDSTMNRNSSQFYGYRLALLYNFGSQLAQQGMQ